MTTVVMGPRLRGDDADDGGALYVNTWNPPNVDLATSES